MSEVCHACVRANNRQKASQSLYEGPARCCVIKAGFEVSLLNLEALKMNLGWLRSKRTMKGVPVEHINPRPV